MSYHVEALGRQDTVSLTRPCLLPRVILMAGVMLSACTQPIPNSPDCDWAQPVRPSREDVLSIGTVEQIVAHNTVGERLCGWQP